MNIAPDRVADNSSIPVKVSTKKFKRHRKENISVNRLSKAKTTEIGDNFDKFDDVSQTTQ